MNSNFKLKENLYCMSIINVLIFDMYRLNLFKYSYWFGIRGFNTNDESKTVVNMYLAGEQCTRNFINITKDTQKGFGASIQVETSDLLQGLKTSQDQHSCFSFRIVPTFYNYVCKINWKPPRFAEWGWPYNLLDGVTANPQLIWRQCVGGCLTSRKGHGPSFIIDISRNMRVPSLR